MESHDLTPILPVWLWSESGGVRLWTPDATCWSDAVAIDAPPETLWQRLRDGQSQTRLEAVLQPADFAHQLVEALRTPGARPLLMLADRPPTEGDSGLLEELPLQNVPFEWLWLDGEPLSGLCVARHVPLTAIPAAPATPGPIQIADLWPRAPDAPRPLAGLLRAHPALAESVRIRLGPDASRAAVLETHPDTYSALVVFCHGSEEDGDQTPLRDPLGQPWELPTANGLPPLVVLLACGTDRGNLIRYGRRLLAHGACTVLAPVGKLDAPEARRFLEGFLPRWLAGERIDLALQATQQDDPRAWGARRLVSVGDPGLRRAAEPRLAEQSNERLAALCREDTEQSVPVLTLLVTRLTLDCFQQGQGLQKPRDRLRELLGISRTDEAEQGWLFDRLDAVFRSGGLGRLTRLWLAPWQAQGAERHDHGRLSFYESQRRLLRSVADLAPAIVYHDWNRIAYREGRYAVALEDVLCGLRALPPAKVFPDAALLVRDLANLLIECDMPAAAQTVARHLQARLGSLPSSEALDIERHYLEDTLARACLRGGGEGWRAALGLFRCKREAAWCQGAERRARGLPEVSGEDGRRELAWLLYTTSWGDPHSLDAAGFADEVRTLLSDPSASRAALAAERGNSDQLYLLRAFAAWAWRRGAEEDAKLLLEYGDLLESELYTRRDAGPLGFVVGYLNLHARAPGSRLKCPLDWVGARERLRGDRYYLEAAAFDVLLGHPQEAVASLALFQDQCADFPRLLEQLVREGTTLTVLGLAPGILEDWATEVRQRQRLERTWLAAEVLPDPADLLAQGLMPL